MESKFLAKFHSGTSSIINTMRLIWLFQLLLENLSEFLLMFFMSHLYLVTLATHNTQLRLKKGSVNVAKCPAARIKDVKFLMPSSNAHMCTIKNLNFHVTTPFTVKVQFIVGAVLISMTRSGVEENWMGCENNHQHLVGV